MIIFIPSPVNQSAVAITGGSINGATIGNVTPAAVAATTLSMGDAGTLVVGTGARTIYGGVIVLTRALDGSAGNPHGFDENSTITQVAGAPVSANGFDARTQFAGTANYGHYVAFQHDSTHGGSGTTTNLITVSSQPTITAGTVTNRFGVDVSDPAMSGGAVLTNNYGIYVGGMVAGTNNWAIYTEGPTPSFIGGALTVGTNTSQPPIRCFGAVTAGASTTGIVALSRNFATGEGGIYIIGDGTGYSEVQSMLEGTGCAGLVFQRRGGSVGVGTATLPSKLTVAGGDIETSDASAGLILKSANGTRYRVTVDNAGALSTTAI